ncbi:MAG: 4-(cytidine 5'-diphospho)-2-C-methyl-D-erythritol kinase [Bacillota bacterium]|nr:4-(cytidine 5'-diphospho)-2-C-methyl-D-erythritol kinase [Bacillota bacterium]
MNRIELKSYGKINLTLDVKGLLDNGFHQVEMIMQQIGLCDDISMEWTEGGEGFRIDLSTNRSFLPTDERNLAYKAALLMNEEFGPRSGELRIHIMKRIPVAAGLAGGSGNGGAILHGLNVLWGLNLDVKRLCELGAKFGSDVPFCVMGQAAANKNLRDRFAGDPLACHCALATGTGTELKPLVGLKSYLVLSKPSISVSTKEVYKGIDNMDIDVHPNTEKMIDALRNNSLEQIEKNLVNILENYTLKEYPTVVYTKNKIKEVGKTEAVLMSGSGPTVFGICSSREEAQRICEELRMINEESFWTETTY